LVEFFINKSKSLPVEVVEIASIAALIPAPWQKMNYHSIRPEPPVHPVTEVSVLLSCKVSFL
jgi:hypothetical protein